MRNMPRFRKWPNEAMWDQCVQWRRGGLTFAEICARLSRSESLSQFSIENVPSQDTVRREVNKRIAVELPNEHAEGVLGLARQQLTLEHIRKIGDYARMFMGQLELPPPHESGSWAPPRMAAFPIGAVWTRISGDFAEYPFYYWVSGEKRPGTLRLGIEKDDVYFGCLMAHLPDREIWDEFGRLKAGGAEYFYLCRQQVSFIVAECERTTGSAMFLDREWPQEGLFWSFAVWVYLAATYSAEGLPGLGNLEYELSEVLSSIPEQGTIYNLAFGGRTIGCHRDLGILKLWEEVHRRLLKRVDLAEAAKLLVAQHQELNQQATSLRRFIRVEVERGLFDRGRRELCA